MNHWLLGYDNSKLNPNMLQNNLVADPKWLLSSLTVL